MRTLTAPRRCSTSALGRGLALLALALAPGCRSSGTDDPQPAAEKPAGELTVEKFQQLINQGALKPVHAMDDDPYDKTKPDLDDDVFGKAVEKLEAGKTAEGEQPAKPADAPVEFPENPYLVFGKRIQVYPESGLI